MILRLTLAMLGLAASACAQAQPMANPVERIAQIERSTGGRLGVALIDAREGQVLTHRADERFAMCSTFKLPLAAMVLSRGPSQRSPLPLTRADLLPNSPWSERMVNERAVPRVGFAAQAIVEQSDNAAANALLRRMGGPQAFTRWLRGVGDPVTRLDRNELALNENVPWDSRDTTSPAAMSNLVGRIVYGNILEPGFREQIRRWTTASRTGVRRIRALLPQTWTAGDKTGSCGTAWNDVAWFESPGGRRYVLAAYLDRPTVAGPQAEAALAQVGRVAAELVTSLEGR